MELVLQIVAFVFLTLGTLLSLVGVIGFVRLPDVYTRLHATGKVSVFGLVFLLVAAGILTPLTIWKALLLIFFVLLVVPSVTHSIASAAYRTGLPMARMARDELKGMMMRRRGKDV
jgi:multicomponent Na+:H+ antiporter subunit G